MWKENSILNVNRLFIVLVVIPVSMVKSLSLLAISVPCGVEASD
jgi:hypothetical protein